jgi:hypothetical protein
MPSGERRPARAKQLIQQYQNARRAFKKRLAQHKAKLRRTFRRANAQGFQQARCAALDPLSELSASSPQSAFSEPPGNLDGDTGNWDSILGPNWQGDSMGLFSDEDDPLALPIPTGLVRLDSDSEARFSASNESDGSLVSNLLDFDADDEFEPEDDSDGLGEDLGQEGHWHPDNYTGLGKWDRLRRWVFTQLLGMYENRYDVRWMMFTTQLLTPYKNRYEVPRDEMPRGPSYLHHVLTCLKNERGDHFREDLRVNPTTFDALISAIEADSIFTNNSNNSQMPIEEQLAITLYRFGHDGNAAGLQATANWAGVAKGTVTLVACRVMTALLRPEFMQSAVRWPTDQEKEDAKLWVEQHSCHAWRNGWCFVDGTLVPLANRPPWYGESYYD